MKIPMALALAIIAVCSAWVFVERRESAPGTYLVTSFDFDRYPVCQPGRNNNCILAVRFYDADSNQRLAELATNPRMKGTQRITAKSKAGAMPHRAYAVTVYLDSSGSEKEGPRGQTTELLAAAYVDSQNTKSSR